MKKLLNFTTFMLMWCILHTSVAMGADLTVKADVLNSNTPSRTKIDVKKDLDLQTTGGLYLPSGTTAQQPVPYKDGMFRYNSTEGTAELFANGLWGPVGGSTSIADWNAGNDYETGDFVIESLKLYRALLDHTASGSFPTDLANGDWEEISAGITAIGSIADNRIARFDGTTGELIQSSTAVLDDSGNLSGINNIGVAGNASVAGTTTLNTSLTGVVKAVSGLLSASALDLSLDVVGTLPIANGGTGATSKSWVDLTTNQGAIAGNKAFTGNLSTSGTMLASNLSGTNTGDLTTSGASGPTTTTNKLKAPFRQMTPSATGEVDIETGNNNELINPRLQATTYNDGWTCSLGTMSQGVGPDGSKALSVVSTGSGFRCRQTFTSSADLKGTLARFYARIKTAAPDVKVCGLDGGILTANEVGCVTVNPTNAGKVFDDPSGFFRYGDTLYGIVIYTNNTLTFPTIIDDVYMGAVGSNLTATIMGDTVYSALLGTSTASGGLARVTPSGSSWISGCSNSNAVICTLSGFTTPPNCSVMTNSGTFHTVSISALSATSISVSTWNPSTNALASPVMFTLVCQKTGADYANSSSSGILSSNADTNWTNFTPTGGWTTNTTYTGKYKYVGDSAVIQLKVATSGVPGGNTALIVDMPALIGVIDTAKLVGQNVTTNSGNLIDAGTATYEVRAIAPTNSIITFYSSLSSISKTYPMTWTTGDHMEVTFTVPIVGRSQSPLAIIPLAETVKVPGANQVDKILFRFGGTLLTNNCTTGTCVTDPLTATSITSFYYNGSSGFYGLSLPRTYSKLICKGSGFNGSFNTLAIPNACSNCSVITLTYTLTTTGAPANTLGEAECTGTY